MSEPLPDLPPLVDVPSAWRVCPLCGAAVPAPEVHRAWHQGLVNRVRAAEDLFAAARVRVKELSDGLSAAQSAVTDLQGRVAALESKGTTP